MTLAGDPDWCVSLWQHDLAKTVHVAKIDIGLTSAYEFTDTLQLSYSNLSTDLTVVVTGYRCYRYLHIAEGMSGFEQKHSKLTNSGGAPVLKSENITCHTWDQAIRLVCCTDQGEIVVCDYDGTAKYLLQDSPFG